MNHVRHPLIGLLMCGWMVGPSSGRPPSNDVLPTQAPRVSDSISNPGLTSTGGSDLCATPEAISGTGLFAFNNTSATLDGPPHKDCHIFTNDQSQVDNDVWFCWTAPAQTCGGVYSIATCDQTSVDTRIAVYNGCACPTNDDNLLDCRDDECNTQTRLLFDAIPGQQYMIRLGTYFGEHGGTGTFRISCELDPPCDEPLSHCQPQVQTDALNSNRISFLAADGFTPTQSGNINSVCWWGTYLNNFNQDCEATSTDSFRIRYFEDAGGLPGALVATFSQQAGTLSVETPFSTGLLISGVAHEYEFRATHTDFPVTAGNCYWFEISNALTNCTWFWELGLLGDDRTVQDGSGGVLPNGYEQSDVLVGDLAFCTNLEIAHDSANCLPTPPPNDDCANATSISGPGLFAVDTATATTDGPAHVMCLGNDQGGIGQDAWFEWTSTCNGNIIVRTCDSSSVDTKIAVYSGTGCPTAATDPLVCNDDLCGPDGTQSMIYFHATANQQFVIRVGSFPQAPGGVIGFEISCGPPNNDACGSGSENPTCCVGSTTDSPGCADEQCCELVCSCDPFCCNVEWDGDCADDGLGNSGCGAADLCGCDGVCGNPSSGSCCSGHVPTPGCDDQACCEAVCACDAFCCETEWDNNCAGSGFVPGCGAEVLCPMLCGEPCDDDSPCPDDGLECTLNLCVNGMCQYSPVAMGTPCGNQVPQGPCDRPDVCNGSGACSPNFEPAASVCRPAKNECDVAELCSGSSPNCPSNTFAPNGSACTMDTNDCTADICQNGQCAHLARPNGFLCGNHVPEGPCDQPDACDSAQVCQPNLKSATAVCRPALNSCDAVELCSGDRPDCPQDELAAVGTPYADDGSSCTEDRCDGTGHCLHVDNGSCGACCVGPFQCLEGVISEECSNDFHLGKSCIEVNCDVIPTMTEWGLLVLVLSLLATAKVIFTKAAAQKP